MPVIPGSGGVQGINQPVTGFPKQDARSLNLMNKSLENLGQVGSQIATQLMQKQVAAKDASYRSNAKSNLTRYSMELEEELGPKYANDPSGYSAEFEKKLDTRRQTLLKDAPYDRTKKALEVESQQLRDKFVLSAFDQENQRIASRDREQDFEEMNLDSQKLLNTPNPDRLGNFFVNGVERIREKEGISYNQEQADKAIKGMSKSLGTSYLDGLSLEEEYERGLDFLEGKDENAEVIKNMDAAVVSRYKSKFLRGQERKKKKTEVEAGLKARDMESALLSGRQVDPGRLQTLMDFANSTKNKEMRDSLDIAKKVNEKLIEMDEMTIEEMQEEARKGIDFEDAPADFNFNKRQAVSKHAAEAFNAKIKERRSGADFYVNNSRSLSELSEMAKNDFSAFEEYIPSVIAAQSQDKSHPHLLSRDMKNHFAEALSNKEMYREGSQTALALRHNLENQFGKENGGQYFAQMMGELSNDYSGKDPTLDLNYGLAARMENPESVEKTFKAIGMRKENEEYLNKISSYDKKSEMDKINTASAKISRDFFQSGNSPVRRKYATALSSMAEDVYIQNRADGMSNSMALDKAIDTVYSQNFSFLSSGESNLILPKNMEDKRGQIGANLRESIKNLDASKIRPFDLYSGLGEKESAELMRDEIKANGVWITNSEMSGAQMAIYNEVDGSYTTLFNKDGDVIEMSYGELSQMPDSKERGFLGKQADSFKQRADRARDRFDTKGLHATSGSR